MTNFRLYFLLAVGLFSLNACQKDPITVSGNEIIPESLAGPVNRLSKPAPGMATQERILGWHECADFADYDMTVCFSEAHEFRCPCDVECFWAGYVAYNLKVIIGNQETIITLQPPGNPSNEPSSAVVGKALISIDEPAPVDCVNYGKYDVYKVKVTVSDASNNSLNER
jgi:hypothetical protein